MRQGYKRRLERIELAVPHSHRTDLSTLSTEQLLRLEACFLSKMGEDLLTEEQIAADVWAENQDIADLIEIQGDL